MKVGCSVYVHICNSDGSYYSKSCYIKVELCEVTVKEETPDKDYQSVWEAGYRLW